MQRFFTKLHTKRDALVLLFFILTIPLTFSLVTHEQIFKQQASSAPLAVHIVGNHLIDSQGQTIRLIGINRIAGTPCAKAKPSIFDGPSDQASVVALTKWHINVVRVTMNEDCWLGINNTPSQFSGSNYRNAIINYIKLLHTYGMYAIIDLHINAPGSHFSTTQQAMADADHALIYWTSVANTFKNDPAVIFEAYNEPDITTKTAQTTNPWDCWLHGCTINWINTDIYVSNAPKIYTKWQSTGMQQIVNTIRATGATNVISISGLNFAHDFSQFLHYLPSDPQHQLAATFHNYERSIAHNNGCGPTCWDNVILPVAKQMPVLTDEFGDTECQTNYSGYVTQYMSWADQHGISYLPWGWMVYTAGTNCPSVHQYNMLSSWDGTPNFYGKIFYNHFAQINPISGTPTSPSPSVTHGQATFAVSVCPHGLGNCGDNANPTSMGNTSPKHSTRNVSLTFMSTANTPVATAQATVSYNTSAQNFQGTISLASIPEGQYVITLKMDGFLGKQLPGIFSIKQGQTIQLPEVWVVAGDINNDNKLNIIDYNIILSCFDTKYITSSCLAPNTALSPGADIDDDGVVDGVDYNLFIRELSVQHGDSGNVQPTMPTIIPTNISIPAPKPTTTTSSYDDVVRADEPTAFWDMKTPTSTEIDITGNGHNGIYKGGIPILVALPNGDQAVDFNGSSEFMTVPSSQSLSISTTHQLTWEAWIRPDVLQFPKESSGGYVDWMGKCQNYSPTCEWEARMYSTSNPQGRCNRLSAYVFNLTAGLGSGADWQPVCNLFQKGQWLHVIGEYQTLTTPSHCSASHPGTINIWVNGVEWNEKAHSPTGCMSQYGITPQASNSPLNIGSMAFDSWFKGAIGKVAIYNKLLSQTQISNHFNAMTKTQPSGSCGATCTIQVPTHQ